MQRLKLSPFLFMNFSRQPRLYDKILSPSSSYNDLLLTGDENNNITTKLYDKRDAFGFYIVNFPFMWSNIPSAPICIVYASQLLRYTHCYSNNSDFLSCHRVLMTRLLLQGHKVNRLSNTLSEILWQTH